MAFARLLAPFELRLVDKNNGMYWNNKRVNVVAGFSFIFNPVL